MSGAGTAAAFREVACVVGRVPGGFWGAGAILLLDVGVGITQVCSACDR